MTNERWIRYQEEDFTSKGADISSRSLGATRVKLALKYIEKNEKVLDLGCNDGAITNEIAKKGNDVLGVDLEEVIEKVAKKKYPHLKFVAHDLSQKFPWTDGSFDVIVALELIEHIPDDDLFLQECFRILKKGGKLILSTPNAAYFLFRAMLLFGKFHEFSRHIHYYTFETLIKKLKHARFKIFDVKGAEYNTGPKKWYYIEKILPKTFKAGIVACMIKP